MTPPRPSEPAELVELRALIRQTLREVLPQVAAAGAAATASSGGPTVLPTAESPTAESPTAESPTAESPMAEPPTVLPSTAWAPSAAAAGEESLGVAVDRAVTGATVAAVTVRNDADLQQLVARVLALADNPKHRADLRSGRLRFCLAVPAPSGSTPTLRYVEKGAVTEGQVKDAARSGVGLRLGRRAVLTPLARDKARALGVVVEREA